MTEYIELDYAGWGSWPRFTHYPSGKNIVRQPWMNDNDWHKAKAEYFKAFTGIETKDEQGNSITVLL